MAWGGEGGQLDQLQQAADPNKPLGGTEAVDAFMGGLNWLGQGINWIDQQAEVEQEGIGDDLWRLGKGGLKNTLNIVNELTDAAKGYSEGRYEDTTPLKSGTVVGHALRLGEAVTEKSSEVGGAIAEHGFGLDPRIGQFAGSLAPELLLNRGAGLINRSLGTLTMHAGIGNRMRQAVAYGPDVGGVAAIGYHGFDEVIKPMTQLSATGKVTGSVVKATTYKPKTNALARYNEMILQGYDFKDNKTINNLVAKMNSSNVSNLPKNITQYTDEALYRAKVKAHLAGGGKTADIRKKIGVFVDTDGSVKQIMSRGDIQLVRIDKDTNTDLNRALTEFQQSPNLPKYDAAANVRLMMKKIGFEGTQKEFTALYHIHHVNSIKVYKPFFFGLDAEGAARLRKLAADNGIFLGSHPNNLTPIIKRKHTLDPDSIHTWQRKFGIEGTSKEWEGIIGSYDPQANLEAMFKHASVEGRLEALLLYREYVQGAVNVNLQKLLPTAK